MGVAKRKARLTPRSKLRTQSGGRPDQAQVSDAQEGFSPCNE